MRSIEKSHNTNRNKKRLNFLSYFENCNDIFEINYDSTKTMTNKDKNKINIDYNDAKKNQIKKRKNNLIGNNTILRNYIIFTLIRSIILNIFSQNILFDLFKFQDSKITLRIKGIGESILFGNITKYSFQNINHLKEVSINGNKQDTIEYKYDFNETDNFVELIWDDNVNNCQNMFYKCSNITEIDLSNFNTSQVTNMSYMFSYCNQLTSLNLSNFNTFQVTNMSFMFRNCSSLTSIDLSNFNTSKVTNMKSMFYGCQKLKSLDLSNFDTSQVKDMYYMFRNCSSLPSLDLSNFDTSQVTDMRAMFYGCSKLTLLNISKFDTSQVIYMASMFRTCSLLTSLDLSNFNTSKVTSMGAMFHGCSKLSSLNLSNINTSLVKNMYYMFRSCKLLKSLDLSNFDTSQVTNMSFIFSYCYQLTSLNLSNFNTSIVRDMNTMFRNCSLLTSLDLSNFKTSKVSNMSYMFSGCVILEYINLNNFEETKLVDVANMFRNVPKNLTICLNKATNHNKILSQINLHINCPIFDCSNDWKYKQKIIINDTSECIENFDNNSKYIYEYNGKCYENYANENLLNENNNQINKCSSEFEGCSLYSTFSLKSNLCSKCNTNFYPKENDSSNIGEYINCYKNPEGYYLDINLYKQCYYTCKSCGSSGNNMIHNCLKCKDDYPIKIKIKNTNYFNCYKNCSYYYYFDNENNYHCTNNLSCPYEYSKLIKETNECIKDDIQNIIEDLIIKKNDTKSMSKEEEIEYYDNIIKIIDETFTENYDTSKLDNGEDEYVKTEKITVTFTTIENQKNNIVNNMTSIYLGQCEDLLRSHYNLTKNVTFYMKKIDVKQEGINVPKIQFDIYYKNGSNLVKLDLSPCDTSKIIFSVPTKLSTDIDKLNASSEYYNNKCYSAKSDKGTDIITKDRQKEFVENDLTLCQENCDFTFYNDTSERANCSCYYKESNSSFANMKINKDKLYDNFGDSSDKKEISNLGITSCNVLGSKENIKSNPGFFSLIIILAIFLIIFIIFCSKGYNLLENKMSEVIYKKFKYGNKKKNNIKKPLKVHSKKSKNEKKNKKIKVKNEKYLTTKKKTSGKITLRKHTINNMIVINQHNNITQIFQNSSCKNIISNQPKLKPDTDYELNWLTYEQAIIYDKRTNCDYYGSLIRSKQLFIFTFCSFNDYNSGIIKKFMFFLSFALHYTINALYFDESNLHQIYEDEGKFNMAYQTPKIILSAIISTFILRLILQFLVLTDKDIVTVKNQPTQNLAINMKEQKLKYMKVKFTFFFILNFILLGLFWYYLTCFNAVYKNTQIYLIENTFISFGFSLFYPFIINIFPTIIRMCSIHSSNKNQAYCYKISQIVQII